MDKMVPLHEDSKFKIQGSKFKDSRFKVQSSRIQDSRFKVQGSKFKNYEYSLDSNAYFDSANVSFGNRFK